MTICIVQLSMIITDDFIYWLVIPYRLEIHGDTTFELGLVIGKVVLHILLLYFDGFLLYQNHVEIFLSMVEEGLISIDDVQRLQFHEDDFVVSIFLK